MGGGGLGSSQFSETQINKYTFDCHSFAIMILNLCNMYEYLQLVRNFYLTLRVCMSNATKQIVLMFVIVLIK